MSFPLLLNTKVAKARRDSLSSKGEQFWVINCILSIPRLGTWAQSVQYNDSDGDIFGPPHF